MIRIAAVGDVHYDQHSQGRLSSHFEKLSEKADLFLIAGDLTQSGDLKEAEALVADLKRIRIPVVTVLGNHDFHQNQQCQILGLLRDSGIFALEGESANFTVRGRTVGIMGLKGFGGGFFGACITEFGEPEMKAFAHHCRLQADVLRNGLSQLKTDYKFTLLHFSPVEGTLVGEKKEIYPFLGSYLLAEAIDSAAVDGVFHGHAHLGTERSATPGGIPVRNVAQRVIQHAYKVYSFG
jgi:Icc-related predicted phosphoesterase